MKKVAFIFLVAIFITACNPSRISLNQTTSIIPVHHWWQDAIFYEIFVRSYYDSNGDGIGDFNGITQKLDYLKNLGVNAIWLMPIYPSPSYHGYDVTDYFNVNPDYGSLDDFKNLLSQAHRLGMHIILDLVLNHTSDQNPWFTSSNNDVSPYRHWYIWSDTNPGYPGPLGKAWFPGKQGYYYGIFGANMPDLNFRNPDVTTEMEKVVSFWLKVIGVDGFRLDAINYLVEEDQKQINTESTHDWLKGFFTSYKADNPEAFTVGEVFGSDATLAATYTGDQVDMIFNFELANSFINSANGQTNSAIDSAISFANQAMPDWQFATFLTNHDQNRTMSAVYGNLDKAKLAAFLLLSSPGTPFIYYGEEIGMVGDKPDPDIRRPMQWSPDANAGFTSGNPWESVDINYQSVNVATESTDPNSLLSFYKNLLGIRSNIPVLRSGGLTLLTTGNSGVYAAVRSYNKAVVLILANLTGDPVSSYSLRGGDPSIPDGKYSPSALIGSGSFSNATVIDGKFNHYQPLPTLPAYGEYIVEFIH